MIQYLTDMWFLALQGEAQGIYFWAAVYALAICSYSLFYQTRIRCWTSTIGDLADASLDKFGGTDVVAGDQQYKSRALYSYCVGDQSFEGKRVSPWIVVASANARFILQSQMSKIQSPEPGKVVVFYNPKRPQKSFLIKPGIVGQLVTAALALIPLLSYFYNYL